MQIFTVTISFLLKGKPSVLKAKLLYCAVVELETAKRFEARLT